MRFEIGFGIGNYSMKDLKKLNSANLKILPVEAKITDNFPSVPNYDCGLFYLLNKHISIGLTERYNTTGSRISYKDFSGQLTYDNILSSFATGVQGEYSLILKNIRFSATSNISYSFSKLKMKNLILRSVDLSKYKSNSIQIEPCFKLSYIINKIELGARAGYQIDFGGKNKLNGDKNLILTNLTTGKEIQNNWSGIRVAVSIGIAFL
jgi:hypothetical protein